MRELQQHVEKLASENGVEVDWRENTNGRSWRRKKKVRIQHIKSVVTYAIALHELGHVLGANHGTRIDKEVQAWEWAKERALVWNKRMQDKAKKCLQSYYDWSHRHKTAKVPDKNHPIHKWLKGGRK